jgi:hypothetical protein
MTEINIKPQLLHWFCFSYTGQCNTTGKSVTASTYTGYLSRKITKPIIDQNKVFAGVTEDSVLVGVFYLGRMSRNEFLGE